MSDQFEKIGEELRAKITSKFQTAAFLGGFSFTTLSIQLTILFQERRPSLLPFSIGVMIGAMVLYFFGLCLLDSLTMPKRFWTQGPVEGGGGPTPWALTDQDLWALKHRMVLYWYKLILFALLLTAISILLILVPVAERSPDPSQDLALVKTAISSGVSVLLAVAYYLELRRRQAKRAKTDRSFGNLTRLPD